MVATLLVTEQQLLNRDCECLTIDLFVLNIYNVYCTVLYATESVYCLCLTY